MHFLTVGLGEFLQNPGHPPRSIIRDSITANNMELTDFKRHSSSAPQKSSRRSRGYGWTWALRKPG